MAEILIKAINTTNADTDIDRRGCYKRGMPVVVMDDGHEWGLEERLPKFIVIKIPIISKDKVMKYIDTEYQGVDANGNPIPYRRRVWNISWTDLPVTARNKLANTGELTVKATDLYAGTYDYTWTQIKAYLKKITTGVSETVEL